MVWLKMGNRNISTAIDLSGLGLDGIQETDEEFSDRMHDNFERT